MIHTRFGGPARDQVLRLAAGKPPRRALAEPVAAPSAPLLDNDTTAVGLCHRVSGLAGSSLTMVLMVLGLQLVVRSKRVCRPRRILNRLLCADRCEAA
jgi:hypothetical protein